MLSRLPGRAGLRRRWRRRVRPGPLPFLRRRHLSEHFVQPGDLGGEPVDLLGEPVDPLSRVGLQPAPVMIGVLADRVTQLGFGPSLLQLGPL